MAVAVLLPTTTITTTTITTTTTTTTTTILKTMFKAMIYKNDFNTSILISLKGYMITASTRILRN